MLTTKHKVIFAAIYVISFFLVFLYVRDALKHDPIKVSFKEEKVAPIKANDITITLSIENGKISKNFVRMTKDDYTVFELHDDFRSDRIVWFEIVRYNDHIELKDVLGVSTPLGYRWEVYKDGIKITNTVDTELLGPAKNITLRLTQIVSTQ
jgi:hypothetical protein